MTMRGHGHGQAIRAAMLPAGHPGKRIFWDVEHREPDRNSRPLMGEEKMMASVLIKAIQDLKGVSQNGDKECLDCHYEEHPACFKGVKRGNETYVYRVNKACANFHTNTECAKAWIASDSTDPGDGEGWTFINLCDHLGIEPTYLRRNLSSREFEAYWADEAKINSFLGFRIGVESAIEGGSEAHDDSGLSDSTGESD